jgi:hypothetical protein
MAIGGGLNATVTFEDGTEKLWQRAPRCFIDVSNPIHNICKVTYISDEKGNRPRQVKLLEVFNRDTKTWKKHEDHD